MRESPTPGRSHNLIVGVEGDASEAVADAVETAGDSITVEVRIPSGYLKVVADEEDLDSLCSLNVVTSISAEGSGSVMASGNR